MTKIALIEGQTVHYVWSVADGATEVAVRYTLPDGSQISPVCVGWAVGGLAVVNVAEFILPEGKEQVGSPVYTVENGTVVETFEVRDIPPPDRVTSRQFKLQLLAEGLIDQVEAWIETQDRAVRIAYAESGTFYRHEPMMQAGFDALELTEQQVDDFFRTASAL